MRFLFVAATLILAACGQASTTGGQADTQPAAAAATQQAAPAAELTAAQRTALLRTLQLRPAANGKVMNACDEAVTPSIIAADLGGAVGRAWLVVIGGGPNTLTCYGMTGMSITLVKAEGADFRAIFSDQGSLAIMPTQHLGVYDIAVGGPGFEFPVYRWNGADYVQGGSIRDTEFPQSLN